METHKGKAGVDFCPEILFGPEARCDTCKPSGVCQYEKKQHAKWKQ